MLAKPKNPRTKIVFTFVQQPCSYGIKSIPTKIIVLRPTISTDVSDIHQLRDEEEGTQRTPSQQSYGTNCNINCFLPSYRLYFLPLSSTNLEFPLGLFWLYKFLLSSLVVHSTALLRPYCTSRNRRNGLIMLIY